MANAVAEQFAEMLLDKISKDIYPSGTDMDMLEAIAPPQDSDRERCLLRKNRLISNVR
jgi:hypothetical protein